MSTATVIAARAGDQRALDALVGEYLPLIYNIVGRALQGHADVDDVVQETMLRVVDGLPRLRDPESFRSWAVAIAMSQVRDRHRRQVQAPLVGDWADPTDTADPGADFADLAITRLRLSGQRQEVAEATRWLDHDDRELLSLWWLEAAGQLDREEVVEALHISRQHAAVRIQRMKAQLDAARAVVRALAGRPRCPELHAIVTRWDGRPSALWRKRLARHTRECQRCDRAWSDMVAAERLLAGIALVPVPFVFAAAAAKTGALSVGTGAGAGGFKAVIAGWFAALKPAMVGVAATVAIAGAAGAVYLTTQGEEQPEQQVAAAASETPAAESPSQVAPATSSAPPSPSPSASKSVVAAPPAVKTAKKGVSTYNFSGNGQALRDVKASWYYNWSADPSVSAISGVEYVPMIWGGASVTSGNLNKAKANGKVLLGFNEPDLKEQANMSVQQALDLWPQLQGTGLRLGSPAPAYGADTPGGWFDQFMSGIKSRGYRVDFIALHWYGGDFSTAATNQLKSYIQNVYNRYKLPIWITEYALMRFDNGTVYPSTDQQVTFVKNSTAMLQGLSYVERYAWFSLPSSKSGDTGLYSSGTTPTSVGAAYRAAGG
ncbi:sigma-70 family RNA polymerase sigma factor [Dactylosporangium sp. AC04546]|uniref:sigma-70 family RNA polymerase sigma factor n=1 Tax=Dactylosporangium sp. AC04546 TaxID=2862460 RepID=UPI001EDF61F5|nr:sigma-70 family RNA polymerase sigma factor [Dactylosporangium sp. AC04546]WVK84368.1 sigma-70 family RNA polymerase sigma factor [Dactylosporangium sp. AC04546]